MSDDASQNSSATDSGGVLRKGRRSGKKQAAGGGATTSSENEDDRPRKKSSKKAQLSRDKRKKRKRNPEDMGTSDGGSDGDTNVKRRKKQKTDDDHGEDKGGHKLKRVLSASKRSGRGSKMSEPDSQSQTGSSPSDGNSDEESKRTRLISNSKKSTMSSQPKKRAHARSRSPLASLDDKVFRGAYVYRAVRQERVALGWSEAPCGSCPVFDFCKEGGPVGPSGCEYYGEWLKRASITTD
jgi:DNA-directed RNA polymerase III subunit RPC6